MESFRSVLCTFVLLAVPCLSIPLSEKVKMAVDANNEFAVDFLKLLLKEKEGQNVFFSPFNISTAFAMTSLGAKGKTLDEIDKVFHFDQVNTEENKGRIHEVYQHLIHLYNSDNSNYSLSTANKLFGEKSFNVLPSFQYDAENYYHAELQQLDFKSGEAEGIINQWIEGQTNKKIKDLIAANSLSNDLLVLVNAIYFKGKWKTPFQSNRTTEKDFHVNANQVKKVNMMIDDGNFNFSVSADVKASFLELPYSGDHLSMFIILPFKSSGLTEVVENLTGSKISDLFGNMNSDYIHIALPKFKLETKYYLEETLGKLGVTDLFSERANLSGLTQKPVLVSKAVHKAIIEVDEEGTEAAAGTSINAMAYSIPPRFIVDRPFIVAIVDKRSSIILFSGLVVDP